MSPQLRETYVSLAQMPESVVEYAERTGVNRHTVATRFRRLRLRGLIYRWDEVKGGRRPRIVYAAAPVI